MKIKSFNFTGNINDDIVNNFIKDKKIINIKINSTIEQKEPFHTMHYIILIMYE
jgi:hypothetical protein